MYAEMLRPLVRVPPDLSCQENPCVPCNHGTLSEGTKVKSTLATTHDSLSCVKGLSAATKSTAQ